MKTLKFSLLFFYALLFFIGCSPKTNDKNSSQKDAEIDKKISELISKMTLEEKIGQMNQVSDFGFNDTLVKIVKAGNVGSMLNIVNPEIVNKIQKIAVEESRLGIPILFARDVIHGFRTIFPIPLGQAASWNPQVAYDGARVAAIEASAVGIRWTFAPMMDVSRDPRWGRIAESCGEDAFLTSKMTTAMVNGFQGENLAAPTSIAACAKHFAAYGFSESGKDYNTTWVPEVLLRDVCLPPFLEAAEAGCASFMCSFNDINGVPSSGNKHLNVDILRNEWNYDGVLVSDWGSIEQMIAHGYSENLEQAAKQAINAGVDMDMMGFAYIKYLADFVNKGIVSEKSIDEAVKNILRMKFRLGLFDNPYVEIKDSSVFYTQESLEKAKRAATESVVLLKNNNNLLPLTGVKSVLVVGPLADAPADQIGTWCFDAEPARSITPKAAIEQLAGESIKVNYVPALTYSRDKNRAAFGKAVATAYHSDAILFFAGEEAILSGEAKCRADIALPGVQAELLQELKKTGKPVVLSIMAGRPLTIGKEIENADAVFYAFHGGTMAGAALADLIFGKAVPSGKLPVTIPKMTGQIPIYYNHKNTGRPSGQGATLIDDIPVGAGQFSIGSTSYHLDAGTDVLFPFGFGLSYSEFKYGEVKLSASEITENDKLTVSCLITNAGKYDALEVVQLYVRDLVGKLIRPVKELKGFDKILLKSGESKEVSFTLSTADLAYWHLDMKKYADKGKFQVWIAPNSAEGNAAEFVLKNKK
jgi:beta-glucosidase